DCRKETLTADLHRHLVVLCLIAKRSCHTAAARRNLLHRVALGQAQDGQGWRRADQGFLMAMAVDQQLFGPVGKLQVAFATLMQLVEEFVNSEGILCHERGVCPGHEIEVVLPERQNTTGLNTDDGYTLLSIGQEEVDVMPRIAPTLLQLTLRDRRAATAF